MLIYACCWDAGEIQACADAAAERIAFLEEQIASLNAEAEKSAADAEAAFQSAQSAAREQLSAAQAEKEAAVAAISAELAAAQVQTISSYLSPDKFFQICQIHTKVCFMHMHGCQENPVFLGSCLMCKLESQTYMLGCTVRPCKN